jgi:hypothetical protein
MPLEQWWDEAGGYFVNLGRILVGRKLSFGDEEAGQRERTIEIAHIDGVTVGIDSDGIFAGICIATTDGGELTLYNDGTICDGDDGENLGRHNLKASTVKAVV